MLADEFVKSRIHQALGVKFTKPSSAKQGAGTDEL